MWMQGRRRLTAPLVGLRIGRGRANSRPFLAWDFLWRFLLPSWRGAVIYGHCHASHIRISNFEANLFCLYP